MVRYLVQHGINVNDRGKRVASEIVPRTLNSDINRIPSDAVKIAARSVHAVYTIITSRADRALVSICISLWMPRKRKQKKSLIRTLMSVAPYMISLRYSACFLKRVLILNKK